MGTACKGCQATIMWIKTQKNKNHPLNPEPKRMWVYDRERAEWRLENCFESHYATCPDAEKFRKKTYLINNPGGLF